MRRNVSIPKLPDPQIFLTGKKLTQEQIAPRKPRRRSEWHAASHRLAILHRSRKKF
jgi:hypothetical protein